MNKLLIKKPIISEKATQVGAFNQYVFLVDNSVNKSEIKKLIKVLYKVDALAVKIINVKPKAKKSHRFVDIKPGYKKAIVSLKKGQKLDILPK